MNAAENWYHYGISEVPYTDVRFAADAMLRIYADGSTVWKTRTTVGVTPNIWDEVQDPQPAVAID